MKDSGFFLDYFQLLSYKFHKINHNHGRSYIDSPDQIKKVAINPISKKDDKCFKYAVAKALNYEEIVKHAERTTKIQYIINK